MTGNSMDAIDVVLTEFKNDVIKDVCSLSIPYSLTQKKRIDALRNRVINQKIVAKDLVKDKDFLQIHNEYIIGVAQAVNKLCQTYNIKKESVQAIGFHGKTLDHNPPSLAKINKTRPFTTQMGSAQMLADFTEIPVINDFRSDLIMAGFEGAPLAAPHNAHISEQEGDGCYINAGNTSNLAWIKNGQAVLSWDAGPFNEYVDNFVLRYKNVNMDRNAHWGKQGELLPRFLARLFAIGQNFYELTPPKSGDPAIYNTSALFAEIENTYGNSAANEKTFCNILHTLEFFSGYLAAYAAASTPQEIEITPRFILFGGGWKNQLSRQSFQDVLENKSYILPQHKQLFIKFQNRLSVKPEIKYSEFGEFMEARLFADLARYYLEGKSWELPELKNYAKKMVLGTIRRPHAAPVDDFLSRAARGWENKEI